MWKKVIAVLLVLVVCATMMITGSPLTPTFKASASSYRSGFSIVPEKEDASGVALDSSFILSSENKVTLDYVKANISLRDGGALEITQTSDGNFRLKPAEPLTQNKVYFFDMKTTAGKAVSFAFQTTRDFTVLGSLPENMSTNVPMDTGIELYFSYPDVRNISSHFEISPKVEGRFESNGYTTVFIPKGLKEKTIYTVTVKKGLTASNGAPALKEDYVFSFETSADPKSTADPNPGSIYLSNSWLQFGSTEKPAVPFDMYVNTASSAEVTLKVFQFKTLDEFVAVIRQKEKAPTWAPYAMSSGMIDTSKLSKRLEFKQTFDLSKWQQKYMMFPETLAEGFYLVEVSSDKLSAQAFMQITDVTAYSIGDKTNTLFWLNNLKTGQAEKGAYVSDVDGGETLKTNDDGLVKLANLEKKVTGSYMTRNLYKVRTSDGKESLVSTGYSYNTDYKYAYRSSNEGLYWRYIQTDRTLYKPNDTAEFWGFAKSRIDGSTPGSVTVELANGGYYYPMKANISRFLPFLSNPLETMTLKTDGGFYNGSIKLPALDPGSYTITVKDGDTVLSSSYFTVQNYVKPQYKLEISSDKKAVFVGEKINFTIKASFFDGTPVSNVPLTYDINTYRDTKHGQGTTDANGALKVEFIPEYASGMQGEAYYGINVRSEFPETGEVSEYYNFRVFANDITFQSTGKIDESKGIIDITANKVKLDTLNDEDLTNDNYTGEAVSGQSFNITVYHIVWEKFETGEVYDAINKVVRKTYDYRDKKTVAATAAVATGTDGKAHYEFPVDKDADGYYTATITTSDKNGRSMTGNVWFNKAGIKYPNDVDYYNLKSDKEKYKAGETVTVQVVKNNEEPIGDMRTLFVQARNGIQGYKTVNKTSLSEPFPEAFAPNYYIQGIVFNGKSYLQTSCTIVYDYDEKKLDLDIKTDKTSYKPGENMTVTIKATDVNGKPVSSMVNISLVDEALLKLSGQYLDPLSELYSWIGSGITSSSGSDPGIVYAGRNGMALDVAFSTSTVREAGEAPKPMPSAAASTAATADKADANAVRSEFKDTALFKTIALDKNGEGTYTFKLPDNITSFSLAAAAVSSDLHAGSDIQSAKVSMPFFINDALSLDYLVGDKPYVGLTAYGEGLSEKEKIAFEVTIKELPGFKQTASAKAFERVNLALPAMTEGTYTLVMSAKSETGKTDALSRTITVYPSYRTIEAATIKNLTAGMKMDAGKSGITTLIFTDAGRGSLINSLHSLYWSYGKRLDQRLVAKYAGELLSNIIKNENYPITPIEVQPSDYKNDDGGYGILPYAGSDADFTALITPLLKDSADASSLKAYFYDIVMSGKEVPASALYALAVLGEPVLLDLDRAAATENLSLDDYLFLGMAYEALSDYTTASEIYQKEISPSLERMDPYIRVKLKNNDADTSYRQTAMAALLASKIDSPDASKLYAYVENNFSKTEYTGVEKVLYLADQLKKLTSAEASFQYTMGGKTYTSRLDDGRCEVIKVPSVNIGQLKVTGVTGKVSVLSLYTTSYTDNVRNEADVSITRRYYNASTGKETTTFAPNDIVKVEISYDIASTAIDNTYEISDYTPAGLKPIDSPWSYGIRDFSGYWYRQFDGQKVTFVVGKTGNPADRKPLVYYARVASPGEYVAEGTVAQGSIVKSSIHAIDSTRIVIKP